MLVIVVSIDCFAAAITYGLAKIRINPCSAAVISIIGCFVLLASLGISELISHLLSPFFAQTVGGTLLVVMGAYMVLKRIVKKLVKERQRGIAWIFLDESSTDEKKLENITFREAVFLGGILSADCFLSGLSAGLAFSFAQKTWAVILNFFGGVLAIYAGLFLGKALSGKIKNVDLTALDGLVLIMLGVMLIFHI